MKFKADFHVHSKYSRATSTMRRNTGMKLIAAAIISMLSILISGEQTKAWMAEWATYKRPALSLNENKVIFECCRNSEGPTCEDSSMQNEIFLVDVNTKELRPVTFDMEDSQLSPDGSKVLVQTYYGLYLLDLLKKTPPREIFNRFSSCGFDSRNSPILTVSWSPDGKTFLLVRAIGFDGKRISSVFNSETGEEKVLNLDLLPCAVAWHPDASRVYFDQGGDVSYLDLTSGKVDLVLSGFPDDPCHDPIISPDGTKVLYRALRFFKFRTIGSFDKTIFAQWIDVPDWASRELKKSIWDTQREVAKEMQYLLLDGPISNLRFHWSRDGEKILISDRDEIWLYVLSDSSFVPIHCDSNTISHLAWSPNQEEICFFSRYRKDTNQDGVINRRDKTFGDLSLFNLTNGRLRMILSELESPRNPVFSSDGGLLAYETAGNIWVLNTSDSQGYPLTASGGTKAQWLADDKAILFEKEKSLYAVDVNGQNLIRLTMAKGAEPVWLSEQEVALKSGGKHWKMALDKLAVEEVTEPFTAVPRSTGKEYEVYVTNERFGHQPWDVSEIWMKEIRTDRSWKIKEAWKNW
ncbi:MAG: hypothetical protein WBD64_09925 [Candidatus Zixiibacteriota bacterium]